MVRRRTTAVLTVVLLIATIVIFTGCIEDGSTKSPCEVVEDFASHHKNGKLDKCYSLMSTQYRNLTDEKAFRDKIKHCNDYYITKIKSEEINGNMASVEIEYVKQLSNTESKWYDKKSKYSIGRYIREWRCKESKTLNLVKEKDGWKLAELYCELKSR